MKLLTTVTVPHIKGFTETLYTRNSEIRNRIVF